MKKLNLPLIATLALFASLIFASCKKDHTCECNVGVITYDTTINFVIEDQTNKNAKRMCENNESTLKTYTATMLNALLGGFTADSSMGGIPQFTFTPAMVNASCELK
ncbi:hypothetical protein [Polluticoccus soli]|uniref:hypothetical protein n=1 Tax=Polluticoccus soli TaxID=3034150 RepID=UPI0023E19805|nr:hypothetical protein [Flavipsychrobacter sp. JY13-12]